MIRTNRNQFWKSMMSTNRVKRPKEAEQPTVTPPVDMIMQYKNDTGKQVKIIDGREILKDPPKNDLKADILKTKDEKDDIKYLPGQRFLKNLNKYKSKPKATKDMPNGRKNKLIDFDSDLSD